MIGNKVYVVYASYGVYDDSVAVGIHATLKGAEENVRACEEDDYFAYYEEEIIKE